MIRRLTSNDDRACQHLLSVKPAENLFIIGDIENFGYDQDFQKLWGDFDRNDQLRAVLLKYHNNYIAYANDYFDAKGFATIINEDPEFMQLSGLQIITEKILPYIKVGSLRNRSLYYAKCDDTEKLNTDVNTSHVKLATTNDVQRLVHLQNQIPEFERDNSREDSIRRGIEQKSARVYYSEDNGTMISSASTTAENSMSAMVVGVCTHPNYKRKGYASTCMLKLCQDLLADGKMLCLFYDNPEAGSIYKRLGFEDIGMWMMHIFEKAEEPSTV
ncbi:GNAT family N-acetyltransferase [Halobacillus shinanisalinarum]|uniref:GNAT family N-acetyltransferase n=1 Tax=Halobacillus shinanisalinarum TaxID=2932258 RepID=A0ABY4GWR3_9BACI|nr:GNAT family N-acetyltransferase [Halobacillus shinanisalinarum]UOQ92605.1 GNAT family N-acetyltransferase [Halobacillus shinanisalinarum]